MLLYVGVVECSLPSLWCVGQTTREGDAVIHAVTVTSPVPTDEENTIPHLGKFKTATSMLVSPHKLMNNIILCMA